MLGMLGIPMLGIVFATVAQMRCLREAETSYHALCGRLLRGISGGALGRGGVSRYHSALLFFLHRYTCSTSSTAGCLFRLPLRKKRTTGPTRTPGAGPRADYPEARLDRLAAVVRARGLERSEKLRSRLCGS